ncbi:MAG: hypothetical protein IIA02_10855 [Proteobacteria bacterium]|nr:hypothetical protein [Pseudomonadota bacterium]
MDLHLLRLALSHFMGQQLTPELASRVEFIACGGEDLSPDPAQFAPLVLGEHLVQVERMADTLDELHALHVEHWQETEKHRHGLALAPDYPAMLAMERAGRVMQFTARALADGSMVGQCRMYLSTSLHTRTLFAQEDTLYLRPAHRGGFLAVHLLRYVERVLVDAIGVREIRADSKLVNNASVLMRRLGYTPTAQQFVKVFPLKSEARNVL